MSLVLVFVFEMRMRMPDAAAAVDMVPPATELERGELEARVQLEALGAEAAVSASYVDAK